MLTAKTFYYLCAVGVVACWLLIVAHRAQIFFGNHKYLRENYANPCAKVLTDLLFHKSGPKISHTAFGLDNKCLKAITGENLRIGTPSDRRYGVKSLRNYDVPHCFKRSLTEMEKAFFFNSRIREFKKILEEAGLQYFMDSGTLLGSLRHLGLPPWGDDIDVFVELKNRRRLAIILKNIEIETKGKKWKFSYTAQRDQHLKFRVQMPYFSLAEDKKFRFSFEIFFYQRFEGNKTLVYRHLSGRRAVLPEDVVFPTILRPFEDTFLPAPRKSLEFLASRYHQDAGRVLKQCEYTPWANPSSRRKCKQWIVPCTRLERTYAFVHRFPLTPTHEGPAIEFLVHNYTVLRAAYVPETAL